MSLLLRSSIKAHMAVTKMLRSAGGIWFPEYDHFIDPKRDNALAILTRPSGEKIITPGCNIVTNDGDLYYAELSCEEAVTVSYTYWEQNSAGTPGKTAIRSDFTEIGSSGLAEDGTYPMTNDSDGDNTGAGVDIRTTRVSYSAASFNHAAITHSIVTKAAPAAGETLLSGWAWAASINKTAQDTLKCFLNHEFLGI